MAVPTAQSGKIITFYSYKGGTGRSMALANIACLLARSLTKTSQRVLMMDWDLEAPGLHRFFSAKCDLPEYESKLGVIDYFHDLQKLLSGSPDMYKRLMADDGWQELNERLPLDRYVIPDVVLGVDFIRAGRFDSGYAKLVGSFNWIEFFEKYGAILRTFRELLVANYAYTLVDSRTGVTDVSGVCTTILPEKVVGVFTPNRQSLFGLVNLVTEAVAYRSKSDDFRPLAVFPLPSRVENAEKDLREQWRKEYQKQFEDLFRRVHGATQCDLTDYFNTVLLPHVSYYAYGENIAVLQERPDAISLSAAYQRFFDRFMNSNFAWEIPGQEEEEAVQPTPKSAGPPDEIDAPIYDAFLSYSRNDATEVLKVWKQLREQGAKIFFDRQDLAAGEELALGISKAIGQSKAVVAFVGKGGSGPWQEQEIAASLENYAKDPGKRIIPVFLPDAPADARLPLFLQRVQPVDLRKTTGDPEALGNLIWAVTGRRAVAKTPLFRGIRGVFAAAIILLIAWSATYWWLDRRGYVGTIPRYRSQVEKNPKDVDARGLLANAYRERGFTDEAIKQYAAAVNLEQDDIGNVGSLSALVDSMGPSKAIEWYQSYLKANPGEGRIRMRLAEQLKLDDKWNDAIAEAKEAVKTKGGNTVANHDNLATMMEVMHDYPGALNEFRAAHDDLEVRQVSRLLGIYPFGIMLSADQDLYPTGRGGPSAIYEVEQALQGGLPNVALYQRPKWYGTVAQYEDQASASAARTQILAAQNGRWKGAAVISIEDWCPNVQFSQTITLAFDGRQQAVSLLICGVRSAAQANPATPTNR